MKSERICNYVSYSLDNQLCLDEGKNLNPYHVTEDSPPNVVLVSGIDIENLCALEHQP